MTKQYITYTYTDPSRDEIIYVGKGTMKRSRDHLKACLKINSLFYNRLRKMLQNDIEPIIDIIECESEDEAFIREIHTIARIGRKDLGLGPLLNQTDGGEGPSGQIQSEDTKVKRANSIRTTNRNPDSRARRSEAMKELQNREEIKQLKSMRIRQAIAKRKALGLRWGPTAESAARQAEKIRGKPSGNKGKFYATTELAIKRRLKKEQLNGK